jgi:excisionase family DNA binding protein
MGPEGVGPQRSKSVGGRRASDVSPVLADTQFLTVAEVAKVMRVSKMTVYRLVHSGELPAVRVGRSFRVRPEAVHAYLGTAYFDAG